MPNFPSAIRTNKIPIVGLTAEQAAVAPSSPVNGQLYLDTTTTPKILYVFDGSVWVPINRYTGAGATNFVAGNDARLTDTRVPTDDSVTAAKINTSLKGGAAAGTEALRALGATSTTALAGNTRLDQLAAPTASVALNGQKITGLGAPVAVDDAVRLSDLQASAAGIEIKQSARAATIANGTLASAFANGSVIDTVTLVTGDRILIKNQTTQTENGIYVVNAAGAPTRSTDVLTPNTFIFVEEGGQQDTSWMITNNGAIVIGTTNIVWAQFGAPGGVSGTTNRITVTGNVIDIAATYVGQTSLTTLGTIGTGTWNGAAIPILYGGTGQTTAAAARTALAAAGWYKADIGALTAGTPLTITHSLGTLDVIVQIFEIATGETAFFDVKRTTTSAVTVTSGISYAGSLYRIVVMSAV